MGYVNTRAAVKAFGVHPNTLRKWADTGQIKSIRTPAGQRLYDTASFAKGRAKIIYARVSTRAQKPDLEQQIRYLQTRYPEHELISDVGGGLNFKRKGFTALLDRILSGDVEELVVAHKDRLLRFGFELIQQIANKCNTRVVVLDESTLSPNEELVQDILSIIHTFSCKLYGLRKYSNKIKEDKDLPGTEEPSEVSDVLGPCEILVQSCDSLPEEQGDKSRPV